MTPYTLKSSALAALRRRYAEQRGQVLGIEPRLADYFDGLVTVEPNADADPEDPQPAHNIYELLGGLKFLRLLRTYPFNVKKVRQVIRLREGIWQQTDMEDADGLPIWEHDTVRATSIDHPDTYFDGEVVWMQTCFAVEDETGHHTPLCQLRAHFNITVTGNKFEGV